MEGRSLILARGAQGRGDRLVESPEPAYPEPEYTTVFKATPSPYLLLNRNLVVVDVNDAYVETTGRRREDLTGRSIVEALPDNPTDPQADGVRNLSASLRRVLLSGARDIMAVQRYDTPSTSEHGQFEERWWSMINTPVRAPDGSIGWIIHRAEDLTAFIAAHRASGGAGWSEWAPREHTMEAELYSRARELQRLNEQLRQAHAREREVALVLQNSMLQTPDLERHQDVAVRYLPAAGSLNVCGDWYDLADLPGDRIALAVGDVVGHGLEAASVMGMLRSALSAAIRAVAGPGQALEILGLYARSVEGALATTAVQAVVDKKTHIIIYSNAGHPPPILLHDDGSCEVLDVATDPPLGARSEHVPRPQASQPYRRGDTLVLYTDGLIERRGEDIDEGLNRLINTLAELARFDAQRLADVLLARLGVVGGAPDDIALVTIRL
ncbi:SpoIIE family protein phosphatase [Streptomyces sp. NPDC020742]|uniref:PP2C family protein-serine/threonine phosphatase n=1 Tax=unclassified Streptomyces TaxID=2593676 RepID=UPI0033DE86EE